MAFTLVTLILLEFLFCNVSAICKQQYRGNFYMSMTSQENSDDTPGSFLSKEFFLCNAESPCSTVVDKKSGVTKIWEKVKGPRYVIPSSGSEAIKADWLTARKHCRDLNGDLLTIADSAENGAIAKIIQASCTDPNDWLWIGLNDRANEGSQEWSDGSAHSYRNWYQGEPNNIDGAEDCVVIYNINFQWNDVSCTEKCPFICKINEQ